mmetsp:Transcript_45280/g.133988  ORF Transcript_45280/g.133988 Transcript_45280/m.133988 type:complete len:202 (+) Transcript_45280:177-782(+)
MHVHDLPQSARTATCRIRSTDIADLLAAAAKVKGRAGRLRWLQNHTLQPSNAVPHPLAQPSVPQHAAAESSSASNERRATIEGQRAYRSSRSAGSHVGHPPLESGQAGGLGGGSGGDPTLPHHTSWPDAPTRAHGRDAPSSVQLPSAARGSCKWRGALQRGAYDSRLVARTSPSEIVKSCSPTYRARRTVAAAHGCAQPES